MSYQTTVLADTPVLYWRFEETSGAAVADYGPNNLAGTCHGTVTRNVATGLAGLGIGVTYGGTASDFCDTPDVSQLDILGDVTYECWVKYTTRGSSQALMCKTKSGVSNTGYCMYLSSAGALSFEQTNNHTLVGSGPVVPNDGQWHHLAVTRSGNVYTPYLDTVAGSTSTDSQTITTSTTPFGCGGTYVPGTSSLPYSGSQDEVAVYNYALSQAQINAHYAARTSGASVSVSILQQLQPIARQFV